MDHHAYLILAPSIADSAVPAEVKHISVDVFHIVRDTFVIDDARELLHHAYQTAIGTSGRSFVIAATTLTREAQNALLKLFEEPPAKTTFYLVVLNAQQIIPTLRSRLAFVEENLVEINAELLTDFQKLSVGNRLALVAEKIKQKDVTWIEAFVRAATTSRWADYDVKRAVGIVSDFWQGSGASKKMLLEELALTLPPRQ